MKIIKKSYYPLIISSILFIALTFAILLVNTILLSNNKMNLNVPYDFKGTIDVIMEDGTAYQAKIPFAIETNQSFKVVLHMEDTGIIDNKTLSFISKDTIINCEVDDNIIYRNINTIYNSYYNDANTMYLIDLPKKVNNNIISLYYENDKNFVTTYELKNIKVGRRDEIISYYFLAENLFELLLHIFLLIFAITVISVSLKSNRKEIIEQYFIYTGLLAVVIAFYILSLLPISYFVYKKYGMILNLIKYVSIMVIPILILKLAALITKSQFKKYINILIIIASINIIVQQLCLYLKIFSLSTMLIYSALILITVILFILIAFVYSKDRPANKENKLDKFIFLMLPLLFGLLYKMLKLFSTRIMGISLFFEIAVVIFFALAFVQFFSIYISYREDKIRANIYKKLAFTDKLTGVGNRAAFDENKLIYQQNHSCFFIIMIDIDNLKYINDNYGHKYGDYIIELLAQKLKNGFAPQNKKDIYRIGGDEFCVIYHADENVNITEMLKTIEKEYENSNLSTGISGYSLSYGYQYYNSEKGDLFDKILHLADQEMYKNKSQKKVLP